MNNKQERCTSSMLPSPDLESMTPQPFVNEGLLLSLLLVYYQRVIKNVLVLFHPYTSSGTNLERFLLEEKDFDSESVLFT